MTSRLLKDARTGNHSYKRRHEKKSAKGQGIYALQLPGHPSGVHSVSAKQACRCGRCSRGSR
jgi:hypothetical protein